MSLPQFTVRRLPLTYTSLAATARARYTSQLQRTRHFSTSIIMAKDQDHQDQHQDQCRGDSTSGISEWKKRPPYQVHDKNEDFDVKYEANCHCERVKYQLSRSEPLDSKLCHCTTCQTQHGTLTPTPRYPCTSIHPSLAPPHFPT